MRMRGKKPIYGFRDTFDLSSVMRPIIQEGLIKYREVIVDRYRDENACVAIPFSESPDEDIDQSFWKWVSILDEMIVGFSEEPDMDDYDFNIYMVESPELGSGNGFRASKVEIDNREEYTRYANDVKDFHRRAAEGRMLFAQYYENLWW